MSPYQFSGVKHDNNKSQSYYGGFGDKDNLPQPSFHERSQSEPERTLKGMSTSKSMDDGSDDAVSPWKGIRKLLQHPAVYATEPDKQVRSFNNNNSFSQLSVIH